MADKKMYHNSFAHLGKSSEDDGSDSSSSESGSPSAPAAASPNRQPAIRIFGTAQATRRPSARLGGRRGAEAGRSGVSRTLTRNAPSATGPTSSRNPGHSIPDATARSVSSLSTDTEDDRDAFPLPPARGNRAGWHRLTADQVPPALSYHVHVSQQFRERVINDIPPEPLFPNSRDGYRRLLNYLDHTYRRLAETHQVYGFFESPDSPDPLLYCFHTGLFTKHWCNLYMAFGEALQSVQADSSVRFTMISYIDEPSLFRREAMEQYHSIRKCEFQRYDPIPERADYGYAQGRLGQLVFDPSIPLPERNINVAHMLRDFRVDRLPENARAFGPAHQAVMIQNAIHLSARIAAANSRLGVPQFFRRQRGRGVLQLLLPISLNDDDILRPDAAVALQLEGDDEHGHQYVAHTLLSLDVARSNARLLQRLDQEWLTPHGDDEDDDDNNRGDDGDGGDQDVGYPESLRNRRR